MAHVVWPSVCAAVLCLGAAGAAGAAPDVTISNVTYDGFAMQWDADPEVRYMVILYEPHEYFEWVSLDIITESGGSLYNATDVEIIERGHYIFAGLDENTAYRYDVLVWPDVVANGTLTTKAIPRPLGEFGDIVVNATTRSTATISWDSVVNASLYVVYLHDTLHGNTTDVWYEFTRLSSGTRYMATVNATNGTHAVSQHVSFRTDSAPVHFSSSGGGSSGGSGSSGGGASPSRTPIDAPTGLDGSITSTPGGVVRVHMTWNAVSNAHSYIVQISADGAPFQDSGSVTMTSAQDHISKGTTYKYRILAVHADGSKSPPSSEITCRIDAGRFALCTG